MMQAAEAPKSKNVLRGRSRWFSASHAPCEAAAQKIMTDPVIKIEGNI